MAREEKFDPEQYTKYERARILGARALQISANAPILIKITEEQLLAMNFDPIKIAELEFNAGILPITVKRPLPKRVEKRAGEEVREIVREEEKEEKPKVKVEVEEDTAKVEELQEAEGEQEEMSEEAIAEEIEKTEVEE